MYVYVKLDDCICLHVDVMFHMHSSRFTRGDSVTYLTSEHGDADMLVHVSLPLDGVVLPLRDVMSELHQHQEHVIDIHTHYQRTYNNLNVLSATDSSWQQQERALNAMIRARTAHQQHRLSTARDAPGSVHHMNITRHQLHSHRSQYRDYCPVCIIDDAALRRHVMDCSYTVEYAHHYYRMCSTRHRDVFMTHPTRYAGTQPHQTLPAHLPHRLTFSECQRVETRHVALGGACPVTIAKAFKKG